MQAQNRARPPIPGDCECGSGIFKMGTCDAMRAWVGGWVRVSVCVWLSLGTGKSGVLGTMNSKDSDVLVDLVGLRD